MANLLLVCPEELRSQLSMRLIRAAGIDVVRVLRPEDVVDSFVAESGLTLVLCDWRLAPLAGAEWVETWKTLEIGAGLHYILMTDRLPTPAEARTIFDKGVSDLWIRPTPDYLLVPRLQVWLSMARAGGGAAMGGAAGSGEGAPSAAESTADLIDPDTLLIGKRILVEQCEGMFAGSRRLGTYVGFLAVAISNIESVLARLGPTGRRDAAVFLANELRAIKRREDLLARWNEDVFVLASYFPKGESVEAFGRRVLGALQASRFPHADRVGPLRFTVSGAWGPSRDYVMAKDALEATVFQALAASPGPG